MLRFRLLPLALFGAIVVAFAGCGDDGDARTEAGLRKAAESSARALLEGDFETAYRAVAKECRDQVSLDQFSTQARQAFTIVEAFFGVKMKDFEVEGVEIRNFTPDGADVAIDLRAPKGLEEMGGQAEFQPWKWEGGRWVLADCSGLLGDMAGGEPSATGTAVPLGSGPRLGEAVEAGDAIVTVHTVEDPARIDAPAEEGKRFIAFDVSVEAAKGSVNVNSFNFSVQSQDGYVFDPAFFGREPALGSTELQQGRRVRGWVSFEVPKDARIVALYANLGFVGPDTLVLDLTR